MPYLSEQKRRSALVFAMGGLGGLVMLDETVLGVSLPAIQSELELSATTAHWILNAYMLAFTCFAAVGGKAIDLFGLRPALIVSCTVFAATSLIAGFADSAALLIAMRVIQGLCAAIMFPITFAAATLTFDTDERGRALGTLAGTATMFLAAGPMLGGALTEFLSWRWVFWLNIPIVAVAGTLACFLWRAPARITVKPEIDRIGLIFLLVGLTALIFGLMEGPDFGWGHKLIFLSLAAGIIVLTVFYLWEIRQSVPLIDVRLFQAPAFVAGVLVFMLTQMSKIVVAVLVPQYLQGELGYSAFWAGLGTVIAVLPIPFLSAPAGKTADTSGSRRPVLIGLSVLVASNLCIGAAMLLDTYLYLAPVLLLWGIALPFAMIPAGRITANSVPQEKQGEVSGLIITFRLIGGTLGVTLGSVLLAVGAGFSAIFWIMATLFALTAVICHITLPLKRAATPR
ncbi:MFS transporter [Labrenzia sp. PHM005]|uniref:MFS transporter n=1 Tax=Labrenzia sp. PHM005 TaxID=2590016 RepID=UPI0011400706|nr:MFS transporter [Labrenzia sp. PHM005]QDG78573.1 MFS transporter [Labrenzia sp. PHM005]